MQKNKTLVILIYILAGLVLVECISLSFLWCTNRRLARLLTERQPQKAEVVGKVALVLDDWGYNTYNLGELFSIEKPITIAVLPNLPFSRRIAKEAAKKNIEVILHLPLEARDKDKTPERGTIYTTMPRTEVLEKLQIALASVPGAKGVSNHMGSKATESQWLMGILFGEFRKRKLYFLDSLVTNSSVCLEAARQKCIRFAERDIFLDNENSLEYIIQQLQGLIRIAKQKKTAIGIGHDRRLTLKAIKQMLPVFEREGIELVYLSELTE